MHTHIIIIVYVCIFSGFNKLFVGGEIIFLHPYGHSAFTMSIMYVQ